MVKDGKKAAIGLGIAGGIAAIIYFATRAKAAPLGYSCPYCGATFNTYEELNAHISLAHPEFPPVADIRVENLRIVPTQVIATHLLKIYVDVHNYSSFTGQRTITLTVTGRAPFERAPILQPGQVYTELYGLSVEAPGTYEVSVDGLWGSFIATAT